MAIIVVMGIVFLNLPKSLPKEEADEIGSVYVVNKPEDKDCAIYIDGKEYQYQREALFMVRKQTIDGYITMYSTDAALGSGKASNFLRDFKKDEFTHTGWPYVLSGKTVKVYFKGGWHVFREKA